MKAVTRLVTTGVVRAVPGGYVLNRDHVAAAAVTVLSGLRAEVLSRIRAHVTEWDPPPVMVGLFGSFARHEGDNTSDIDLLVIRATPADAHPDQSGALADAVRRWTGNEAHVVDLSVDDLSRMASAEEPILSSWRDDLVPLVGTPPPVLTRERTAR